jgi:purine-binding chemotaxis protein CheW
LPSTESILDEVTSSTLLFRVGTTVYGCDIGAAQEIIPLRRATRLPGAPAYVRGLINVRGTIVTVVDLGARLEAGRAPIEDGSILLVRRGARLVGLVVDEVVDVRSLAVEPLEHEAGIVAGVAKGQASGAGTGQDAPIPVLDIDALIKQVLLS